jgi:hypothetical protein
VLLLDVQHDLELLGKPAHPPHRSSRSIDDGTTFDLSTMD